MGHQDSVRMLASLLRTSNEARPVFLLGAGASFSSGVPLAAESVRRMARRVFADKVKGGAIPPENIKLSEWMTWLQSQAWFIKGEDRLADNFPLVVENLLQPREYRTRILQDMFRPSTGIGAGYRSLAELVRRGLLRTVLTTNFDTALPTALNALRPHLPQVAEINRSPGDTRELTPYARAQIVWLHGKSEQYSDQNAVAETATLNAGLADELLPFLKNCPLIVAGYRGAELSITEDLLTRNAERTLQFKHGIFWCVRKGESLHPHVEALQHSLGSNFRVLEIDGFDELMAGLDQELAGEDLYPGARASAAGGVNVPFDDREWPAATIDDLDQDLMLTVMKDYCAKLGRAPVTADTLTGLLREQGFLVTIDEKEYPTVGCVLLFGKNPQQWFPNAVVSASITGKGRLLFDGNLLVQRKALLEWLSGENVNPQLKVKKRATHAPVPAYPPRALVELIINLLVHRDYERLESASVNVEPGRAITFSNPGGLTESAANIMKPDADGHFRPVANASDLRNRALCDVFYGINAMERGGTGLPDVEALARGGGGDAGFVHDSKGGMFRAEILQPIASAGSKSIARDDRPVGVYVFNVLPFAAMPEFVIKAPLTTPWEKRPVDLPLEDAGTFIKRDNVLYSFVPPAILAATLGPLINVDACVVIPRERMEANADDKRIVSRLLRRHFERHLYHFRETGLMLEGGRNRGRRAYFSGVGDRPRMHTYNTAQRKNIRREVVKRRGDDPRPWFENEGFGFEITQLDGVWAVRIKPFYMFTGRDAKTPLPAFTRTARATRRMKLDRNKNVEDDLTFWGRFLSEGSPTINIGQEHVDDLILEGSFLTIDVPEDGLMGDDDAGQNRMSA